MYNADLPAASMRAKRRKLNADPSEANAVALQPEVELAADSDADLADQEQNKQLRVQKDRCLL